MAEANDSPTVSSTEKLNSELEKPSLEDKLIKQVEYYFGDNNLPRDKFIKGECCKHDGWLPIETLLTFNRLKAILSGIPESDHVAKIAEVLKASELVDVDNEEKKLRRNPEVPLPDSNSENRTVYMKGFHRTETNLDDLLEYFGKYEGMEAVLMRYYKEKVLQAEVKSEEGEEKADKEKVTEPKVVWARKFKGSIFVVFKTPEQAKKLLDEDKLVFRGSNIALKMLHSEYKSKKRAEYVERVEARNKKKKEGNGSKTENTDDDEKDKEPELAKDDIVKGALIRIKNIPEGFSREQFKIKWYAATNEEDCKIIFADFQKGDVEGVIRLEKEGSAAVALKLLPDGKIKIDDEKSIDVSAFEEQEEIDYLGEITKKRQEKKRKTPNYQRGRGRGRGGKRRRY